MASEVTDSESQEPFLHTASCNPSRVRFLAFPRDSEFLHRLRVRKPEFHTKDRLLIGVGKVQSPSIGT
jgi:hypothetical protein